MTPVHKSRHRSLPKEITLDRYSKNLEMVSACSWLTMLNGESWFYRPLFLRLHVSGQLLLLKFNDIIIIQGHNHVFKVGNPTP